MKRHIETVFAFFIILTLVWIIYGDDQEESNA